MVHFPFSLATATVLLGAITRGAAAAPAAEAAAAAPVQARAPFKLPDGLPDGFYTSDGSLDPKTGFAKYEYLGPPPTVNGTEAAAVAPASIERRATVNCPGRPAGNSVGSVESQWGSVFNGFFLNAQSKAWLTVGSSRAFVCNYDSVGKNIFSSTFYNNMGAINAVCGNSQAGWHENPGLINYGRDHINSNFCF